VGTITGVHGAVTAHQQLIGEAQSSRQRIEQDIGRVQQAGNHLTNRVDQLDQELQQMKTQVQQLLSHATTQNQSTEAHLHRIE
jgi:chromosome segregation ATPase